MSSHLGFGRAENSPKPFVNEEQMLLALQKTKAPEFLNRVQVIPFQPLSLNIIKQITRQQLKKIASKLLAEGKELHYDEAVIEPLSQLGYRPEYGARALERVIAEQVLSPIADRTYHADWPTLRHIFLESISGTVRVVCKK